MKFRYSGYGRDGTSVDGTIDASDRNAARDALRRDGVIVLQISDDAGGKSSATSTTRGGGGKRRKRVSTSLRLRRVCMFTRQLQVLLASGTPILQSMSALQRQADQPDWGIVVGDVFKKLEEGSPLSDSLRTHPEYFDSIALSLVCAGEASGNMSAMFERLSVLTRKQLQLRAAITGAMVYPCILIGIGFIVLCVMLLFVLPRFEDLFHQIDSPLPMTTVVLMTMSHLLRDDWWAALIALVVGGVGGTFAFRRQTVRNKIDKWLLRIPKFGRLMTSLATAKLSRMLGTLLECKVPLLDALDLTQQSLKNQQYADLVHEAHEAVTRGEPMSSVFSRSNLVSACVQEALVHGESSGQLGIPLIQMADFLDEENDSVVKALTRLLEPLILAVLGVIVGGIAMSMFLPLFDLVASAGGNH